MADTRSTVCRSPIITLVVFGSGGLLLGTLAVVCWPRPAKAPPVLGLGSFPAVTTLLEFASNPPAAVAAGYKKHGNCFTISVLNMSNLTFVLGPTAHERFFSTDDRFVNQSEVYKFMTPVFGRGIVYDAPKTMMYEQLAFISKALKGSALHDYVPKLVKEANMYFDKHWKDGAVVDMHEALSQLTILTASSCLLGPEVRETLFEEVAGIYHKLDEGIKPLSFIWPNAPTSYHAERDVARKEMGRIFAKVIAARRARPDASTAFNDVLQVFIDSKYRDGSSTTDEQVVGLLVALLFAGQHTSSITATWLTLLLHSHPAILRRVREEQEVVLARDDSRIEPASARSESGQLGFAKLEDMPLLNFCMQETLRLYPPLIFLMRKVMGEPLKIGDYEVPVGDILVASPQVSHRLPTGPDCVFTSPDSFDPDRFDKPREEHLRAPPGFDDAGGKSKPKNFVGFGAGYHSCRGEKFAFVQVKTILSVMLSRFDIEMVDPLPEPNFAALVVGPKPGTNCRIRVRRPHA